MASILPSFQSAARQALLLFILCCLTTAISAQDCPSELTFNPNRTFNTQTDLDAFVNESGDQYECVANISVHGGDENDPITDLSNLMAIRHAESFLIINLDGVIPNLSLPQLRTASSIILRNNRFQQVDIPVIESVSNSIVIQELDYTLTSVELGDQVEEFTIVNGTLNVFGFSTTQIGYFNAPTLSSIGNEVSLGHQAYEGVGAQYYLPSLREVGGRFLAYGSIRDLILSQDGTVIKGSLNIRNNSKLALLSSGPLEIGGNLTVSDNVSSFNFALDVHRVGSYLVFRGPVNGPGTEVKMPNLEYVGGSITFYQFCAGSLDLSGLETAPDGLYIIESRYLKEVNCSVRSISGPLSISGASSADEVTLLRTLDFPNLTSIGGSFSLRNTMFLKTLDGFSSLTTVGNGNSSISIRNNDELSDCCLLPCQVSLNGEPVYNGMPNLTIASNSGDCRSESILFESCSDVPVATWTMEIGAPPTRPLPFRPYFEYTPDYTGGTSYVWTLNGSVVSTQPILYLEATYFYKTELCLTITNETCGETTHCEDLGSDVFDEPGPLGVEGGRRFKGKSLANNTSTTAFPNPFTEQLTVVPAADVTELQLLDVTGRRIRQLTVSKRQINLETSDLPTGLYFLRGFDAQGQVVQTQKVIRR